MDKKWEEMRDIAQKDLLQLIEAEKSYGDSLVSIDRLATVSTCMKTSYGNE